MTTCRQRKKRKNSGGDLVEQVVSSLRGAIIAGRLPSGGKLPSEGKLATEFGVSRNVVREAMRELRAMGLVEMSQGRSPRVKASDPITAVLAMEAVLRDADHQLEYLHEVRTTLESGIAALACRRRTPDDLARLAECIDALAQAREQNPQMELDYEFHRRLAETTRNPVFMYLLETLSGLIRRSQETTYPVDGWQNAVTGHREILAAVTAGDETAAAKAVRDHLGHAETTITKQRVNLPRKENDYEQ